MMVFEQAQESQTKFLDGFGTIRLTEPCTVKDIVQAAAYGDTAILQMAVCLLRDLGGFYVLDDDMLAREQVRREGLAMRRPRAVYSSKTEPDKENFTLQDVEFAFYYNICDAKWEYRKVELRKFAVLEQYAEKFTDILRRVRQISSFTEQVNVVGELPSLFGNDELSMPMDVSGEWSYDDDQLVNGFGVPYHSEPTRLRDIIQAAAYGDESIKQWTVNLVRKLPHYDTQEDDYLARGQIENCRGGYRMRGAYSQFFHEDAYTREDVVNVIEELLERATEFYAFLGDIHSMEELARAKETYRDDIERLSYMQFVAPIGYPAMTLSEVNFEISGREWYGTRRQKALGEGYVISWSNGAERWIVNQRKIYIGTEMTLDANEVFVIGDLESIQGMIPDLYPLPLYANSVEGKSRMA